MLKRIENYKHLKWKNTQLSQTKKEISSLPESSKTGNLSAESLNCSEWNCLQQKAFFELTKKQERFLTRKRLSTEESNWRKLNSPKPKTDTARMSRRKKTAKASKNRQVSKKQYKNLFNKSSNIKWKVHFSKILQTWLI
jgi:hypothetical protein